MQNERRVRQCERNSASKNHKGQEIDVRIRTHELAHFTLSSLPPALPESVSGEMACPVSQETEASSVAAIPPAANPPFELDNEMQQLRGSKKDGDLLRVDDLRKLDKEMRRIMDWKTEGDYMTRVCLDFARSYPVGLAEALCTIQRRSRKLEGIQVEAQKIRDNSLQYFGGASLYQIADATVKRLSRLIAHLAEVEILAADDVDWFLQMFHDNQLGFQMPECFVPYAHTLF